MDINKWRLAMKSGMEFDINSQPRRQDVKGVDVWLYAEASCPVCQTIRERYSSLSLQIGPPTDGRSELHIGKPSAQGHRSWHEYLTQRIAESCLCEHCGVSSVIPHRQREVLEVLLRGTVDQEMLQAAANALGVQRACELLGRKYYKNAHDGTHCAVVAPDEVSHDLVAWRNFSVIAA